VGVWVIAGVGQDLWRRAAGGGFGRLIRLPLTVWGMAIAHIGIGVFVIGATVETATRSEQTFPLAPGQSAEMNGWVFEFQGVKVVDGPNYVATRADILATHDGRSEILQPEQRSYPVSEMGTTEVAIRKTLNGDVYVALGDQLRDEPGAWRIRIAHHPLIDWVFAGAGLIALGGFLSLTARLRARAPGRAQTAGAEAPEGAAAPEAVKGAAKGAAAGAPA
jgi:cytochrome c-type biogenesis protein CcmF